MFLLLYIFNDFCQINYRNIYGTDLHPVCRDGRTMAVDERTEVIFFRFLRDSAHGNQYCGFQSTERRKNVQDGALLIEVLY